MKTHTSGARMLALAALLALMGGARAAAAGGARSAGACGPHTTPKITANAKDWGNNYAKVYGEDIILQCAARNVTHLQMKEYSKSLQTTEVNTTTAQYCVKKPNLGKYRYSCVDGETGCGHSVIVEVRPAVSVESARVHYKQEDGYRHYFVPLSEHYEVFCSSHDSNALTITMIGDDKRLQNDVINSTSKKYSTRAGRVEETYYDCSGKVTTNGEEDTVHGAITVTVDHYPESHNFSCIIYEFSVIECLWNYSSKVITFQLFFTDLTDGYKTLLCVDKSGNVMTGACKVDEALTERKFYSWNKNVSLLLMSCNFIFCNNQSFSLNTAVITKVSPVSTFKVLKTSAHGIALTWITSFPHNSDLVHKVEYRQKISDDDWRLADLSSLRCDDSVRCNYRLAVLYPDVEYEVRVYCRNNKATDDRLWSKPSSLSVTTKPRVQCACSAAQETPAELTTTPKISPETASCELCTHTEYAMEENLALKNKISSLKERLAKVNKYSRF